MKTFDDNFFIEITRNLQKYKTEELREDGLLKEQMKILCRTYLEKNIEAIKKILIDESKNGRNTIIITPINDTIFCHCQDYCGKKEKEKIRDITDTIVQVLLKEEGIDASVSGSDYKKIVIRGIRAYSNCATPLG